MANKPQNLLAGLSNSKTRTFVILLGAIIIIGILVAFLRSKQSPEDVLSKQSSQAVPVPADIKATPGNVTSEKFRELQIQENERRAQEALQKKSSAIPTIIGAIGEGSEKGNTDAAALEKALRERERDRLGRIGLGGSEGGGFTGGGALGGAGTGGGAFGADGASGAFGAGGAGGAGGAFGTGSGALGGVSATSTGTFSAGSGPGSFVPGVGPGGVGPGGVGPGGVGPGGVGPGGVGAGALGAGGPGGAGGAFGAGAGGGAFGTGGAGGFGAGAEGNLTGKTPAERARELQEQRLREQREALDRQRAEQERLKELERQRRLAEQQQREYEASVQKIAGQMKSYANSAYAEWSKFPNQQFVQGDLADKPYKRNTPEAVTLDGTDAADMRSRSSGASSRATRLGNVRPSTKKVYIKAGTILFGTMDTAVNSDEPGPVLATIVSGKYHGGKLIGTFQHQAQQTTIIINFSQMTVPKKSKSFSVSAVAIDPETARTALATDFDRHLLQRYGSLFASSFIQGYGQAITQQGTTTTSPLTGATTTTTPPLDNKEIFFAALGELGKQWSQAIKPYFQTPYTVYVDKGTSVGLLFLNDVDVTDEGG